MSNEINEALRASQVAAAAGNTEKAGAEWRRYIGLLELSMRRTGLSERPVTAAQQQEKSA